MNVKSSDLFIKCLSSQEGSSLLGKHKTFEDTW